MASLKWSPAAIRDVERLHDFLKSKNAEAARRAAGAIRQGVRLLIAHPEAGRPVEGRAAEFREWPIAFGEAGYVALYHFDGREVVILAVKHSRELGY